MLILVLGLIVAAVWLLRRLQRGGATSALDLEIVGRVGLAPKQFLSVVRVGKEFWVLGVSSDSIRFIGEYQGDPPQARAKSPVMAGFSATLEHSVKRLGRSLARHREPVVEGRG